jgi:chromosome segregation ATPase
MALAARPATKVIQDAIDSAKRSREDLKGARESIREMGGRLAALEEELEEANTGIEDLRKTLREKEAELLSETDRCHATEVHWIEVARSDIAQLKSRIRERLSHEVSEAELCLDRDNPNASMALDRIRRIRIFLDNLGG